MLEVAEAYLVNDTHTKIHYTAGRRATNKLVQKKSRKKVSQIYPPADGR